jgi:hypothetical protein
VRSLPPRRSAALRLARAGEAAVVRQPATTALLVATMAAFLLLKSGVVDPTAADSWASTNIENLSRHPISALVASAFVVPGLGFVEIVALLALCGTLERRLGTVRVIVTVVAGHVLATLLTEGWVRVSIAAQDAPLDDIWRSDVGLSYVVFTAAGAVAATCVGRVRLVALACGGLDVGAQLISSHSMTGCGHAISFAVGALVAPLLAARSTEPDRAQPSRRRGIAFAALAAMTALGVLMLSVPLHTVTSASIPRLG